MQLFWAQYAHWRRHHSYTSSIMTLLEPEYCSYLPPRGINNYCRKEDVLRAVNNPHIFSLRVSVDNITTTCVQYASATRPANATGGPCFVVEVRSSPSPPVYLELACSTRDNLPMSFFVALQVNVSVPDHHAYTVHVTTDRFVSVMHPPSKGSLPCLNRKRTLRRTKQ